MTLKLSPAPRDITLEVILDLDSVQFEKLQNICTLLPKLVDIDKESTLLFLTLANLALENREYAEKQKTYSKNASKIVELVMYIQSTWMTVDEAYTKQLETRQEESSGCMPNIEKTCFIQ